MRDIKDARQDIDRIDTEMIRLFEERMKASKDVVEYKKAHHMDIFQKDRESEVINKNLAKLEDKSLEFYARNFIISNMNLSKRYQASFIEGKPMHFKAPKKDGVIVGYQGVPGSFSYAALNSFFGRVVDVNYPHFEDVFIALKQGEINYGVLPLENSSTGAINDNYDLITKYGFRIIGEQSVNVEQCLLGVKGATLDTIQTVYSHPQGLLQCEGFLDKYHMKQETYPNTAMAAKLVAVMMDPTLGAIASREAAGLYNLEVVAEAVQDIGENHTRFIIIGKDIEISDDSSRLSMVFTLRHEVGALYEVMQIVQAHRINMARIESRPLPGNPWEYYFYLDLDGNLQDYNVQSCVEELRACTYTFRLLGNYERHAG